MTVQADGHPAGDHHHRAEEPRRGTDHQQEQPMMSPPIFAAWLAHSIEYI